MVGLRKRSLMGFLLALGGGGLIYRAASGHCKVYEQLGIDMARGEPHDGVRARQGHKHESNVVIQRDPQSLYSFWRELENLPALIDHLQQVEQIDETRSRWVASDPFGREIEWEAEIHNEAPGEMIAWRSVAGSELDTAGSIHFRRLPTGRGSTVTLSLKYDPPAGKAGAAIARMLGRSVEEELESALRQFKQLMEAEAPALVVDETSNDVAPSGENGG